MAKAEIQKYFRSFFGANENFTICFRDLLTFSSSTSSRLELIKVLKRRDYYSQHTVDEYFTRFLQISKGYTATKIKLVVHTSI